MAAQQTAMTLAQHGTSGMLVTIPDEHVGRLIGKQGVTIKNINDRCRVRCILPQQPDPGSYPPVRTITVQGEPQCQAMAKYEIETIIYNQQMQLGQTPTVFPQLPPQAYAGSVGMYGAAAGGVYGAAAGGVYGAAAGDVYGYQQQQQQYATAGAAQAQAQTQAAPAKDHNDPTAYYTEFWQYATYYGEAAARAYYKAWSPPEGTPPPAGIVLPAGSAATTVTDATTAAATADATTAAATDTTTAAAAVTATAAATDATTDVSSPVAQPSSSLTSSSSSATVTSTTAAEGTAPADDAAAREAWEKYEREMAEWKRLYGDETSATSTATESATTAVTASTNQESNSNTN